MLSSAGPSVSVSSLSPAGPFPSLQPLLISKGLVAREEVTLAGGRQETGPGPPKEAPALTPKTLPRPPSSPPVPTSGSRSTGHGGCPAHRHGHLSLCPSQHPPQGLVTCRGPLGTARCAESRGVSALGGLAGGSHDGDSCCEMSPTQGRCQASGSGAGQRGHLARRVESGHGPACPKSAGGRGASGSGWVWVHC